jgi:hypothetical protein
MMPSCSVPARRPRIKRVADELRSSLTKAPRHTLQSRTERVPCRLVGLAGPSAYKVNFRR